MVESVDDDGPCAEAQDNSESRERRAPLQTWLRRELLDAKVGPELATGLAALGAVLIERFEYLATDLDEVKQDVDILRRGNDPNATKRVPFG